MANLKIRKKADLAMVHQGGLLSCHCSMYRQRLIEILTAVNCTKPPILTQECVIVRVLVSGRCLLSMPCIDSKIKTHKVYQSIVMSLMHIKARLLIQQLTK